ncbi:putative oxidoreductase [Sphingomonas vulcanisoli]|uniref:Oxidoreductase n=1 Tax=Sphingomonas vulcanisoli TaxID=1658060 RepID=A0ABX0TWJ3_9SPHN|nr:SDR family oxidoreductase [Sphingomonas vulcanisoli]NIJ07976.1 putative oxidoreductase [Sphingomonas vulcanisoli]
MKTSGNTILITGGGSGIGEALAHRFHDAGNTVIVSGRRKEALESAIAGRANMHAVTLDISDKASIADFAQRITTDFPALNVLINNAGIMRVEDPSSARPLDDAEATIATNLLGPIRMIDALVDHLKAQADAAIVNVSSGLAFVPLPATPTYAATKAALHSYTITLREHLRDAVEVIELAPPGVQTELTPGQSTAAGYMPLDAYIDEVMALFAEQPTPAEILVEQVKPLRFAEASGKFGEIFARMAQVVKQRG